MKTKTEPRWVVAGMLFAQVALGGPPTADLSITNTTMPRPATVRKNLTYGMNVINRGPDAATNVQVMDTLPAGVTLVSATFSFPAGCRCLAAASPPLPATSGTWG